MNAANVISVDPGKKTLGTLNLSGAPGFLRTNIASKIGTTTQRSSHKLLNLTFASVCPTSTQRSGRILLMRLLLAGLMTACALLPQAQADIEIYELSLPHIVMITLLVAAGSMTLGLLMRPVLILSTGLFFTVATLQALVGEFNVELWFCGFSSLMLAISGSGRISLDGLFHHLLGEKRSFRKRQAHARRRMSYEAFKFVDA